MTNSNTTTEISLSNSLFFDYIFIRRGLTALTINWTKIAFQYGLLDTDDFGTASDENKFCPLWNNKRSNLDKRLNKKYAMPHLQILVQDGMKSKTGVHTFKSKIMMFDIFNANNYILIQDNHRVHFMWRYCYIYALLCFYYTWGCHTNIGISHFHWVTTNDGWAV